MSWAWAGGSTRQWRRTRARVLVEAGNRCQLKLDGVCAHVATEVHHVHGKGRDESTLVAACGPCNKQVGDPTRHDPAPTPRTQW